MSAALSFTRNQNFSASNQTLSIVNKDKSRIFILTRDDHEINLRLDSNIKLIKCVNNLKETSNECGLNEMLVFNFLVNSNEKFLQNFENKTSSVVLIKLKNVDGENLKVNLVQPYQKIGLLHMGFSMIQPGDE